MTPRTFAIITLIAIYSALWLLIWKAAAIITMLAVFIASLIACFVFIDFIFNLIAYPDQSTPLRIAIKDSFRKSIKFKNDDGWHP